MSKIEWTDATWNPLTGCTKVSPGCKNCYMMTLALRLKAMGQSNYRNGSELTLHPHMLEIPMRWKKSRMIFVNSMSDIFHEDVPDDYVERIFDVMTDCPQHQFQVLTKRAERLAEINQLVEWTDNVWMGVSVENADYVHRIDLLRETDARVNFLSLEPLIGPLGDLDLEGIDWVIVGGESGTVARPMKPEWARDIRDQCVEQNVAFLFKQWGAFGADGVKRPKRKNGRKLDDRTWDEYPDVASQSQNTLFEGGKAA